MARPTTKKNDSHKYADSRSKSVNDLPYGYATDIDISVLKIAIIIPCYNEGPSIATVVADFYVMNDGDDTYDATIAHLLVEMLVSGNLDMVNGAGENRKELAGLVHIKFHGSKLPTANPNIR